MSYTWLWHPAFLLLLFLCLSRATSVVFIYEYNFAFNYDRSCLFVCLPLRPDTNHPDTVLSKLSETEKEESKAVAAVFR